MVDMEKGVLPDQLVPDEQEKHGTDYGYDELAQPVIGTQAEKTEEPASEGSANDSQNKVDKASFSLSVEEFAGYKAGNDSGDYTCY